MSLSEGKDGDRWLFSQGFGEWRIFVAVCVCVVVFYLQGVDELYYFTSGLGS